MERRARQAGYKVRKESRFVISRAEPKKHIDASLLIPVKRPVLMRSTPTNVSSAITGPSALTPRAILPGMASYTANK